MKCSIDLKPFRRAFGLASKASPARSPLTVLQSVLLDCTGDVPTLAATDMEVSVRLEIPGVRVLDPGRALLPRQLTDSILAVASGESIDLEVDGTRLVARCGRAKWPMATEEPGKFPDFAKALDGGPADAVSVSSADLARAISRVEYACEKPGGSSYALAGIHVGWAGGRLRVSATDSYRFATQSVPADVAAEQSARDCHVIPRRLASLLSSVLGDRDCVVGLSFPGNSVAAFRFPGGLAMGRLVEGRFPIRYLAHMAETKVTRSYRVGLDSIRSAIGQAAAVACDATRRIDLQFSPGTLAISSPGSEVASSRVEIDLEGDQSPFAISVGGALALDPLASLDGGEIDLVLRGEKGAVAFSDGGGFDHYLQPITVE